MFVTAGKNDIKVAYVCFFVGIVLSVLASVFQRLTLSCPWGSHNDNIGYHRWIPLRWFRLFTLFIFLWIIVKLMHLIIQQNSNGTATYFL